jgi:hypothetical protein
MKKPFHIDVFVNFTPGQKPTGFFDFVRVKSGGEILFAEMCSASPNGYQPRTREKWFEVYGCVAPSTQPIEIIPKHRKFGDCILVNGGHAIPSINKNPNHNMRKIITEVFFHRALGRINKLWRGSAGCLTMPKAKLKQMIKAIRDHGCGVKGTMTIHHGSRLNFEDGK